MRGYELTRQAASLQPYTQYRRQQARRHARGCAAASRGDADAASAGRGRRAAERGGATVAEPPIAAVRGRRHARRARRSTRGKAAVRRDPAAAADADRARSRTVPQAARSDADHRRRVRRVSRRSRCWSSLASGRRALARAQPVGAAARSTGWAPRPARSARGRPTSSIVPRRAGRAAPSSAATSRRCASRSRAQLDARRADPGRAARAQARSSRAPTTTCSSSPTSPRTTCPSRCARSRTSASCSSASTARSSTTGRAQYIDFAVDGAKRMQALITDLLALSRVGRTTERFETVDLDAQAGPGAGQPRRAHRRGRARRSSGSTPLPTVSGDRALLISLFENLVGNAVKYRRADVAARGARSSAELDEAARMWTFTVQRQRHRHRPAVRRADLRGVPATAPARPVRRHRDRPGAVPPDRRVPRRADLAG